MATEISDILNYCRGFNDEYDYLLLAQEFYDLGKKVRLLDKRIAPLYVDVLSLVYTTIDHASALDHVHKVVLAKAHSEISSVGLLPGQLDECNNRYSALALNSQGLAFAYNAFTINPTSLLDASHFYAFFREVADKTLSAYWAPYPIDSQSLYDFIWYAFQMGNGMDARTATLSRLEDNQKYHAFLN